MIGNKYMLFGTTTIFEVESDDGDYWVIKIYIEGDESKAEMNVRITKQDMADSIHTQHLALI